MGKTFPVIDDSLRAFIEAQPLFFVSTAPLDPRGHVNVSPKGLDSFRVLGPTTVAYLDLTGSGVETIAHLKENRRITVMFCAFQGTPKVLRLYGEGTAIEPGQAEFKALEENFPRHEGVRAVIRIELSRISDSCGYGVPLLALKKNRDQLGAWIRQRGAGGLIEYRKTKNHQSIDGLPGLAENADRK